MSIFTKIAFRNVIRHVSRNALIGISIAVASGLLFFILSLSEGVEKQLVTNLVQIETGAVSFAPEDEILKGETSIDAASIEAVYAKIQDISEVSDIRERIHSRALINTDNSTADANIRGVDWNKEPSLFSSLRFKIDHPIDSLMPYGILISQNMADKLHVKEGDYCSILVQTVHGSLNLDDYTIDGIYENISGWANTMVFMNIDNSKTLINTEIPTNVLIDAENLEDTPKLLAEVTQVLQSEFNTTMDIESYKNRSLIASTIANANKYGFLSIVFFLQIISFFGIAFVVSNNVIERNKEIGTLIAIGFRPGKVRFSFILETMIVGIISSLIGLLLFGILTAFLSEKGIFLGDTATVIFGSSVLKPSISYFNLFIALVAGVMYPLLSAYWSTRRVRKADPIALLYDR